MRWHSTNSSSSASSKQNDSKRDEKSRSSASASNTSASASVSPVSATLILFLPFHLLLDFHLALPRGALFALSKGLALSLAAALAAAAAFFSQSVIRGRPRPRLAGIKALTITEPSSAVSVQTLDSAPLSQSAAGASSASAGLIGFTVFHPSRTPPESCNAGKPLAAASGFNGSQSL